MTRSSVFLAVSTVWILSSSVQGATILLSENFDELTPQLGVTSAGAFSAIGGTNVDIVGGSVFGSLCVSPESGNCVDLDGTGGNPVGVLQANTGITLEPGTDYYLSFDLIGSQRGVDTTTVVTFGDYSQTFNLASSDTTSGIVSNLLVTVSSPTFADLTFQSLTPGQEGALLDNVLITSSSAATSPTATPEPSTFLPGALALLLIACVADRRAKNAA